MKPARQLLTVSFVLLFSACTKDSIDIGDISGVGGTTSIAGASGGVTTDPVGNGGMSGDGTGGAAAVPGSGGTIPADPGSGGTTTAPLGTGGSSNDGLGGVAVVPGSGGAGGATTAPVGTGGTISPGTGGAGGLGSGGVGGLGSGGVGGAVGAGGTASSCAGPDIVASDVNNYTIATSLVLSPVKVKALADLTFDWGGVTSDTLGRPVVPATDIGMVYVMVVGANLKGLQNKLDTDTLSSRDLVFAPPVAFYPKGSRLSAKLSEFTFNGTPIGGELIDLPTLLKFFDPALYPPENNSYLMTVTAGTAFFQDVLMMQAFQVDTAADNTTVAMGPRSTTFSYSADLRSLTPVDVPTGQAALTLDFGRGIYRNGLGATWDPSFITSAIIGRYTQTLPELEAGIFDLDRLATDFFQVEIPSGSTVDLATLTTAAGKHFAGIDSTGTWLLGLSCGPMCRNPAPWFVTVLKPCGTP